jgi:hypothetical protein
MENKDRRITYIIKKIENSRENNGQWRNRAGYT